MKAFFAAAAALGLEYQKPIRRYEVRPTISQHMKSNSRLLAMRTPSMPPAKSARKQKKRVKFSSCSM
jgi:hypothetical protein